MNSADCLAVMEAQARRIARLKAIIGEEAFERMKATERLSFACFAMASPKPIERKDVTDRADKMKRNSCLLYKTTKEQTTDDPWSYCGVLKLEDGQTFWVFAWPRIVRGEPVVELKFTPKK